MSILRGARAVVAETTTISIDAMGGDHGPPVVVPGVARHAELWRARGVRFLLHGDQARIEAELAQVPAIRALCEIRHTDKVIGMDEKPAHAMRRGAGTSLWNALESVRDGEAQAAVSSGNTGALMAIARLILRMVGELKRPALVGMWPTLDRPVLYIATDDPATIADFAEFAPVSLDDLTKEGTVQPWKGLEFLQDFHVLMNADVLGVSAQSGYSQLAALLNRHARLFVEPDAAAQRIRPYSPWTSSSDTP